MNGFSTGDRRILKCVRMLLVASTMCFQFLADQRRAAAALEFTVTPSPDYRSVIEGDSGIFDFTVKNVGATTFTIDEVIIPITNPILFVSGDAHDEVFSTQLVNVDNCKGKSLGTNGSCQFQQTFQTRDLDIAASGNNVGLWKIGNIVGVTTATEADTRRGTALVEVRDPNAVSELPEPTSAMLCLLGLMSALTLRSNLRDRSR
jgi:hypothetical protein